jgi:nitrogen-specific signal transduction histidine kinase
VLSNLSSGVLFLTLNGLVRRSNTAARNILGFASPAGMNVAQIFRDASLTSGSGPQQKLAEQVQASLRGQLLVETVEAQYVTPGGEQRVLEVTMTPVSAPSGELLGAACLINDKTEMARIRRQQQLRGEMSSEMALALRNSLATISGYAQQLAASRDPQLARQLAADIAYEAATLDHTIGGFLAGPRTAKAAAGA